MRYQGHLTSNKPLYCKSEQSMHLSTSSSVSVRLPTQNNPQIACSVHDSHLYCRMEKKTHMLSLKKTPGQNMNNHFNKYKIAHKHKGQFSRHRLSLLLKKNYGDSPPAPQFIPKLDLIHWETRLSRFPTPTTMVMILVRNPAWSGCSVSNQVLSGCLCLFSSECICGVSFQGKAEAPTYLRQNFTFVSMPLIIMDVTHPSQATVH